MVCLNNLNRITISEEIRLNPTKLSRFTIFFCLFKRPISVSFYCRLILWGCSSSHLGVSILDFGLTWGVLGKIPSYLAVKVSFRVAREKIQKYIIRKWVL